MRADRLKPTHLFSAIALAMAALYSIAAFVYFAAHGNIAALWSKDFISTLPLLAGVALPYALF